VGSIVCRWHTREIIAYRSVEDPEDVEMREAFDIREPRLELR